MAHQLPQSGSDISVENGIVVWRMSAEVADFYGVELESISRTDAGVTEDRMALLAAATEIEGLEATEHGG